MTETDIRVGGWYVLTGAAVAQVLHIYQRTSRGGKHVCLLIYEQDILSIRDYNLLVFVAGRVVGELDPEPNWREEAARLREALKFYANEGIIEKAGCRGFVHIGYDRGERARKALKP